VLAGLWLGAWAADLVTGLVHWACDTWGDERTRWLGAGLVLTPERHARHHRPPHTGDYCIAGGWLDPALARATGATPQVSRSEAKPSEGHQVASGEPLSSALHPTPMRRGRR
jgi:hypothetical protein